MCSEQHLQRHIEQQTQIVYHHLEEQQREDLSELLQSIQCLHQLELKRLTRTGEIKKQQG